MDKRLFHNIGAFLIVLIFSINSYALTQFQSSTDLEQDVYPAFTAYASWFPQHQSLILEITNHSTSHHITQFSVKHNPLMTFGDLVPVNLKDTWSTSDASPAGPYETFKHIQSNQSKSLGIPPGQTRAFKLMNWSSPLNLVDLKDSAAVEHMLFKDEGSAWIKTMFLDHDSGLTHQAYATKYIEPTQYVEATSHPVLPGSIGLLLCALFGLYLCSKPYIKQKEPAWPAAYSL